jgi:cytochrome c biogenesis protein CcmG/thiol:disulfide interchange protein DsbE
MNKKVFIKAAIPVVIFAALLLGTWNYFSRRLSEANRVSDSTQKLNELQEKGVPHFTIADLKGNDVSLEKFKDKIVILNFWASWCDPCVKEFPSMMKLIDHFQGDVVLLAISADNSRDDIDNFLRAFKVNDHKGIHIAWDNDQNVAKIFGTQQLPESYVFARGSVLKRKVVGLEDWNSPNVISFFKDMVLAK